MYDLSLVFGNYLPIIQNKKIWVAFSGGIDSHVLLHSFVRFLNDTSINVEINAIHVNHGLNKDSNIWQEHVSKVCDDLHIKLVIENVNISSSCGSIEENARKARYRAFNKSVQEDEILFIAHHQDDQAETLLFRLLRGSGVQGLSAIPKSRSLEPGTIIRPLLNINKEQIIDYAVSNNLKWIDDYSNNNLNFDRNYLRHKIFPLLKERWPNYTKNFQRAIDNNVESRVLLDDLALIDIDICRSAKNILRVSQLNKLSITRQKNVIRHFIITLGFRVPSSKLLNLIISDVINAKYDATPELVISNYSVRRFKDFLYIIKKIDKIDLSNTEIEIDLRQETVLPDNIGVLMNSCVLGEGISVDRKDKLLVKFRQGGEKILSASSKRHLSLKKMFSYWNIPPWERNQIPIIYHEDRIVSVVGYYNRVDYLPAKDKYGLVFNLRKV
ncbi:MAG: tRNA lysidine(34) synthetase TilS [Legionellales bacterium]|nr:tRNA lysidine(34) synthetase TilS [Legionellales bacterium]